MTPLRIHKETEILTALSCSRYQEQELTSADSRHFVNSIMTNKSQRCSVDTSKRSGGRDWCFCGNTLKTIHVIRRTRKRRDPPTRLHHVMCHSVETLVSNGAQSSHPTARAFTVTWPLHARLRHAARLPPSGLTIPDRKHISVPRSKQPRERWKHSPFAWKSQLNACCCCCCCTGAAGASGAAGADDEPPKSMFESP